MIRLPGLLRWISNLRDNFSESRYYIYLYITPSKILLFAALGVAFSGSTLNEFLSDPLSWWRNTFTYTVYDVSPVDTVPFLQPQFNLDRISFNRLTRFLVTITTLLQWISAHQRHSARPMPRWSTHCSFKLDRRGFATCFQNLHVKFKYKILALHFRSI